MILNGGGDDVYKVEEIGRLVNRVKIQIKEKLIPSTDNDLWLDTFELIL